MLERAIGLISDTHGLLRPQAVAALQGCAHIVHAGDVGPAALADALRAIAPLTIVRGNNDDRFSLESDCDRAAPAGPGDGPAGRGAWPDTAWVSVLGKRLFVLHELSRLGGPPAGADVVVYGHSHQPRSEWRDGVLYLNPGSAGPRRFSLPVTLARLHVGPDGGLDTEFVQLL